MHYNTGLIVIAIEQNNDKKLNLIRKSYKTYLNTQLEDNHKN